MEQDLLQNGGALGVLGIFVLMLVREVLGVVKKSDSKGCLFPQSGIEQLSQMYRSSIQSEQQFDRLINALEKIGDRMAKGECPYE